MPLGTFCSAEGKAGPTGSRLFVPLRARLGPKSLSVTGPETAVGHLRSTEGKAGPTDSTLFRSTEDTAGCVAGLEAAVGHPSFP